MSDFTPEQVAFIQAEIRKAQETSLPFRFIGNQVVTDKDWDFRSLLTQNGGSIAGSTGTEDPMNKLSASTDGQGIKVAASSSPGTIIHTAAAGTDTLDEVWIWAMNTGVSNHKLTLQWGGTTDPDDLIEVTVTAEAGLLS